MGPGGVRVGHWTFNQRVLDLTKVRPLCEVSANTLEPTRLLHIKLRIHEVYEVLAMNKAHVKL
jgi:hypothetical protein